MQIEHIATSIMITATRRIHQTGRIIPLRPLGDFRCFKLPPCFIKRHPCTDTGIRIQTIHDLFPFFAVTSLRLCRTLILRTIKISAILPFGTTITTRHVLPYDNAQTVTMGVPACRLHLDVFTDHIITEILGFLNVIQQSLIGRRRIQTIRPPALIEGTKLE